MEVLLNKSDAGPQLLVPGLDGKILTPQQLLELDGRGHLQWENEGIRTKVFEFFNIVSEVEDDIEAILSNPNPPVLPPEPTFETPSFGGLPPEALENTGDGSAAVSQPLGVYYNGITDQLAQKAKPGAHGSGEAKKPFNPMLIWAFSGGAIFLLLLTFVLLRLFVK